MNKTFFTFLLTLTMLLLSCEEIAYSEIEQYKTIIYLLSKEDYNIYSEEFDLAMGSQVTGFFSVGIGGTQPNESAVSVSLSIDTSLVDKYNLSNYDLDTTKYAKVLVEDRYIIETFQMQIPPKNNEQYVKGALTVNPQGLSPDSIYFIPIKINEVSSYEFNPEKSHLLYKIVLKNKYSTQLQSTYYRLNGMDAEGRTITGSKWIKPIAENKIRMYAGGDYFESTLSQKEEIDRHSIIVEVNTDNTVDIFPYKSIEVEIIDTDSFWNTYEEYKINNFDQNHQQVFYLNYRYRIPINQFAWTEWKTVKETLTRIH